jgi:hypothetical protein
MALPVVAAAIIGGVVTAITQFFVSRAGSMLVGLGITISIYTGLTRITNFIIADLQTILSSIQGMSGGGSGPDILGYAIQLAAFAGFFDGINIILSGFLTVMGIKAMRVWVGAVQKP